jgi:hypothetical protein
MKRFALTRLALIGLMAAGLSATLWAQSSSSIPPEIITPGTVDTPIGTLKFFDGVPTDATVRAVYDNLDRSRGVEVFLNLIPGVSMFGLREGPRSLGQTESHQVVIFDKLMSSESLFLTANTSTMYAFPFLDLKKDGPTVVEVPAGMLGAFNDMWFRYASDVGPAGPDKGKGGKYLVLPPGHTGDVPDGYYVVKPRTYGVWIFLRGSIADGLEAGAKHIKDNLRIYSLARKDDPPAMEFISGSAKAFNTVLPNDFSFYEQLNQLIQEEPAESIDLGRRSLCAAIGIEKGKEFNPDARMKKILEEAAAIGNATARAIVWYPRERTAKIYPDSDSAWVMAFAGKDVFFEVGEARNLDARTMFHYAYTAVTPAMAVTKAGIGSDYGIAFLDSRKRALDGSKTYRLHLPPNVPVNNFWAVTLYDSQTRSMLQTSQPFPTLGSQSKGFQENADGSYDVYFGPQAPQGHENNWLETIPGKSWFIILRMYGPLQPWIDKTWRPDEIELVN